MKPEWLEPLKLDEFYTVTREYLAEHLDSVLEIVNGGCSPIRITEEGKTDLLLFDWDDYMRRFSKLLPPEELEALSRLSDSASQLTSNCSQLDQPHLDKE